MRVSQLPSAPRVSLHVPNAATFAGDGWTYWLNVQVWPMYSDATQMDDPSATAAP
jgi:hypothetical protein